MSPPSRLNKLRGAGLNTFFIHRLMHKIKRYAQAKKLKKRLMSSLAIIRVSTSRQQADRTRRLVKLMTDACKRLAFGLNEKSRESGTQSAVRGNVVETPPLRLPKRRT